MPRGELAAGEYTVMVVGFAASSQFRLDVELVLPARQLRPDAQIAMGQARTPGAAMTRWEPECSSDTPV